MKSLFYAYYNITDSWFYLFSTSNVFFFIRFSLFRANFFNKKLMNILFFGQMLYRVGFIN